MAIELGAAAIGLVGAMPSGPGPIDDATIAAIARTVPPPIATFLLTSRTDADGIIDHARHACTTTVQLVDEVEPPTYGRIRKALPALKIVQVIHVTGPAAIAQALLAAPHVDALLLDSGNPSLAVKELGGTGRVHDWAVSRQIVETAGRPVFLAGGITPANVGRAIDTVRPFAIDLCSGVRTNGRLDRAKLSALVSALA